MGMCAGKCAHFSPHERHLAACCGQKIIQGFREKPNDPAQLWVFDAAGDKHATTRNAKTEEEVFGYNIISQENNRGGGGGGGPKEHSMPKTDARNVTVAAAGDSVKTLADMNLVSSNGEKVTCLRKQPTSTDLNMYIVTWNMNGKAIVRSIAKLLDVDGERHDLYVIGLQEAHNSIAESAITEALGEKYSFVAAASMLSLQLFIIAKKTVLPFLSRPLMDKISTGGLGGLAGRQKGAVAITLRFKETSLLFIACHLIPHEANVGERNAQYRRIANMVFAKQAQVVPSFAGVCSAGCSPYRNGLVSDEPGLCLEHPFRMNSKFVDQADMVVWMGDLNYRVEMSRSSVAFLIRHKLEEVLWSKDQLTRALKRGQAFIGFKEGPLLFRPTYKYDVGTDDYDTSSKERVPSWTDRILYKLNNVGDTSKFNVNLKSYNSINSIKSSDHRPVKAVLTLSLNQEKSKYV